MANEETLDSDESVTLGLNGSNGEGADLTLRNETMDELAAYMKFTIHGIPLPIVCTFGIVGNVISVLILSKRQMRSSINCCLLGLAACDLVLLFTSLWLFAIPDIYIYTRWFRFYVCDVYPYTTPYAYPISLIAQTSSVYITMTVAVERYIAVCWPLKARSLCTFGRARLYVIAIVICATLYNIPRFFEVTWKECPATFINGTRLTDECVMCVLPTDLRSDQIYVKVYIWWMYLIVMFILPFLALTVFNLLIYVQVRRANKERQRLTSTQKREIGLAVMILCVVVVFFICNTLAMVINILEMFDDSIINYLTPISNLLVNINSTTNFIIYCIFGQKFQKLLLEMFCWCCPGSRRKGSAQEDGTYTHVDTHQLVTYSGARSNGNKGNGSMQFNTRSPLLSEDLQTPRIEGGSLSFTPGNSRRNSSLTTINSRSTSPSDSRVDRSAYRGDKKGRDRLTVCT